MLLTLRFNNKLMECQFLPLGCQSERNAAMAGLRELQLRVLVSTDLTARGVDVENVNVVINMDLPADAETYTHRVGRTRRFETPGTVVTLLAPGCGRVAPFLALPCYS
jgi:superfamily II DNA/RNA helicase